MLQMVLLENPVSSSIKIKLGQKRCAYILCNKILYFTFRNNQDHCNTECANLDRRYRISQKSKLVTAIKKQAKIVYDYWIESGIEFYKLSYLDQCRIKLIILSPKAAIFKGEYRRAWERKYWLKVRKKKNNAKLERYHIIKQLKFVKFWDRVEHENI